jgi:hypothetical protein
MHKPLSGAQLIGYRGMIVHDMSGLTPLEEKFLDRVWAYFRETGSWPSTSLLEIGVRKEGNARKQRTGTLPSTPHRKFVYVF